MIPPNTAKKFTHHGMYFISFAGVLSLGIPLEIVFIGIPLEIVFKGVVFQ